MYECALNILKKLHDLEYEAYIIGGFPRDKFLGINSNDIDICTNATPNKIISLFKIVKDNSKYGSLIVEENSFLFEITTFRKDIYLKNRYPKIEYVNYLKDDLIRRDFIINTLCIDYKGNYIDLLNAKKDLKNKIINSIGNADDKFKEDPLRIFRAIRFALKLNFNLSDEISKAIENNKKSLKFLSKKQIKKEIDKITKYKNNEEFLKKFNLQEYILSK